jgi:AraC-like DNA-binding protein
MDDPEFSVNIFAEVLSMSRPVLYKKIHAVSGLSVNDFIKNIRLNKAAELLKNNDSNNISEVAYMVGFTDPKYFSREFKKKFGKSPRSSRTN